MQIVSFILGALGMSAIVIAVARAVGFSGWAAIGMGAACFVLAQVLYLVWLAGMARAEARRRKIALGGSGSASAKPTEGLVQKG